MEQGKLIFFGVGTGGGGGTGPGDGGGDPNARYIEYNHPTLGQVTIPVMAKFTGGLPDNDTFPAGPVKFSVVELNRADGSILLVAYDVVPNP